MGDGAHLWGRSDVRNFKIELKRASRVFIPGEVVEGDLVLETTAPIPCRGLRMQLEHKSVIHWHTGSGDDRRDYHGERVYARERRTVWGNVFTTPVLGDAGSNCVWGSPMAPSEGHIEMPLRGLHDSYVVLRVNDYDWGKRDDLLGECLLSVDGLLAAGGQPLTLHMYRKQGLLGQYGPCVVNGQPSTVVVSAVLSDIDQSHGVMDAAWRQGLRRVVLRVHAAMNLRSADMAGGNDVYCQLYELAAPPPGFSAASGGVLTAPLPDPPKELPCLPVAQGLRVPFRFKLPRNLPSSLERVPDCDYGFVRCSVYAHIDIAWRLDPSCRAFISIVQAVPVSVPRLLVPYTFNEAREIYGIRAGCGWCCECCLSCWGADCCEDRSNPLGKLGLALTLPRMGWAPGECILLPVRVSNGTAKECTLQVQFIRHFHMTAGYAKRYGQTALYTATAVPLPPHMPPTDMVLEILVPLWAPDYHGRAEGGAEEYNAYAAALMPQTAGWVAGSRAEPILWHTTLRVVVDAPNTPFDLESNIPIYVCGIPYMGPGADLGPSPPLRQEFAPVGYDGTNSGTGGGTGAGGEELMDESQCRLWFTPEELEPARRGVAEAPPPRAGQEVMLAADAKEDGACDRSQLEYSPTYFVATPATRRFVSSPHAPPGSAPVDVTALPPMSVAVCPYTGAPFVVPY